MSLIYKITNIINRKVYIGKTKRTLLKRLKTHVYNAKKRINRYLYDSMNKYGYDKFIIELLEDVDDKIENEREIYWIDYYKSNQKQFGYNMTTGGDGGRTGSHRKGKSNYSLWFAKYGKEKADELDKIHRKNLSNAGIGRIVSRETARKISEGLKKSGYKYRTYNRIKEKHGAFGKPRSEETKKKISEATKGKTWEQKYSYEVRQRMRARLENLNKEKKIPRLTSAELIDILNILLHNKYVSVSQLCEKFNKTRIILMESIRNLGIKDFKKFRCQDEQVRTKQIKEMIEELQCYN